MISQRQPSVYICDHSEIVVLGIRTQLENSGFRVLGTTSDPSQAVLDALELRPELVIIGLYPRSHAVAVDAIRQIKQKLSDTAILVFTSAEDEIDLAEVLNVGADGYCTKTVTAEELRLALETISRGNAWLHKPLKQRLLGANSAAPNTVQRKRVYKGSESQLSPREREILFLITQGLTNNQIAAQLHISTDTVKTHVRKIMEKLQCKDRTAMAVKAVTEGIM
jgi:RNA polymerase sigma factor (sigma-70 family)